MKEFGTALTEVARNFSPLWVFAIFVGMVVAYRLPGIISAIFTGIREGKRVKAETRRKQQLADVQLRDRIRKLEEKRK